MIGRIATVIQVMAWLALATGCQTSSSHSEAPLQARGGIGREDLNQLGCTTIFSQDGASSHMQRPATPGQGVLRGAMNGAMAPLSDGDPRGLLLVPVTSLGGAVAGLMRGTSAEKTAQALSTLSNALAKADLSGGAARELAGRVGDTGTPPQPVRTARWPTAAVPGDPAAELKGVQTALLVRLDDVTLASQQDPLTAPIDPPLYLSCQWSAEFRDIPAGAMVRHVSGTYEHPERKRLRGWAATDARAFRKALETATRLIAAEAAWELLGLKPEASPGKGSRASRLPRNVRVSFVTADFSPRCDHLYIAPVQADPALLPTTNDEKASLERATADLRARFHEAIAAREIFAAIDTCPPDTPEHSRCLRLDCTISGFSRGNATQRWLVGFGAGMPWVSIRGELTAVETGQRVLAFEARAQSDWFTKSGYKTARIQSEERLELARAVAALLIQLAGGSLRAS